VKRRRTGAARTPFAISSPRSDRDRNVAGQPVPLLRLQRPHSAGATLRVSRLPTTVTTSLPTPRVCSFARVYLASAGF
jgi:hypothetical protein